MCFENSKYLKKSQSSSYFYHGAVLQRRTGGNLFCKEVFLIAYLPIMVFSSLVVKVCQLKRFLSGKKVTKMAVTPLILEPPGVTAILFQTIGIYDYSTTSEPNMAFRYKHPQ